MNPRTLFYATASKYGKKGTIEHGWYCTISIGKLALKLHKYGRHIEYLGQHGTARQRETRIMRENEAVFHFGHLLHFPHKNIYSLAFFCMKVCQATWRLERHRAAESESYTKPKRVNKTVNPVSQLCLTFAGVFFIRVTQSSKEG